MPVSTALKEAEAILRKLTPSEKAQLLHLMVSDLTQVFPGIEKTPGVCGGNACIAGTRIPVWLLIRQHQLGFTEERQLEGYPSLRSSDIANALNYYSANKAEIDAQILENEGD